MRGHLDNLFNHCHTSPFPPRFRPGITDLNLMQKNQITSRIKPTNNNLKLIQNIKILGRCKHTSIKQKQKLV